MNLDHLFKRDKQALVKKEKEKEVKKEEKALVKRGSAKAVRAYMSSVIAGRQLGDDEIPVAKKLSKQLKKSKSSSTPRGKQKKREVNPLVELGKEVLDATRNIGEANIGGDEEPRPTDGELRVAQDEQAVSEGEASSEEVHLRAIQNLAKLERACRTLSHALFGYEGFEKEVKTSGVFQAAVWEAALQLARRGDTSGDE